MVLFTDVNVLHVCCLWQLLL